MQTKRAKEVLHLFGEIYLAVSTIPVFEIGHTSLLSLCEHLKIEDLLGVIFKNTMNAYTNYVDRKIDRSTLNTKQKQLIDFLKKVEALSNIEFDFRLDWIKPDGEIGVLKLHGKKKPELKFTPNVDDEFKAEIKTILNDHPELLKFLDKEKQTIHNLVS